MINRRKLLYFAGGLTSASIASGCGLLRIDPMSPFLRSEVVDSPEKEKEIVSLGRLSTTSDGRVKVLFVQGTPYEMGYQHGYLLREDVRDNLLSLYDKAVSKLGTDELFDEAYERLRPYISDRYLQEMHGLAHGSKLPIRVIHAIHALPEISEWGGKKKLKKVLKQMMDGDLGTSCSNLCVNKTATKDGKQYTVRVLDWGLHRISKLHEYPLITVARPFGGIPYANIGWVGFLGAVSGMNESGITLGEMGYGDPENESLRGVPMPFVLRDILWEARNLKEVQNVITRSTGTSSFVFLMSDGKTGESEMYVRDRDRFLVMQPGQPVVDKKISMPAIEDTLYGGHYKEKMPDIMRKYHGTITPEVIMNEVIPQIAMPSNFQNVIYDPKNLKFWVSNAASRSEPASKEPYTEFDLRGALNGWK